MAKNKSVAQQTTLLIDSDIVAFQFASTHQSDIQWDADTKSRTVADIEDVKPKIKDLLDGWMERLGADALIVCLSVPSAEGWRKAIYPPYKAQRDGVSRPELLMPLKAHLAEAYPSYIRPTLEADDVMGILSTHPTLIPGKKIIVSEDKDMKTIPGWLWNPRKDKKPWLVSEDEADYWHMYQTLMGDATDGYPGCPNVGPKTAESDLRALLRPAPVHRELKRGPRKGTVVTKWAHERATSRWDVVVSHFRKAGLSEDDALTQARLARICRHTDYDFKKKEVKLWTP